MMLDMKKREENDKCAFGFMANDCQGIKCCFWVSMNNKA